MNYVCHSLGNDRLIAFTKNARIGSEERIAEALVELSQIEWDIILFTEARCDTGEYHLDGNHILFSSGCRSEASGVAILVNAKHAKKKLKVSRKSFRIMGIEMKIGQTQYLIISCYLPHVGYAEDVLKETYLILDHMIDKGRRNNKRIVVGGDFQTEYDVALYREMKLIEWAESNLLKPANVNSDMQWYDVWTFESNVGNLRQIDYIFLTRR